MSTWAAEAGQSPRESRRRRRKMKQKQREVAAIMRSSDASSQVASVDVDVDESVHLPRRRNRSSGNVRNGQRLKNPRQNDSGRRKGKGKGGKAGRRDRRGIGTGSGKGLGSRLGLVGHLYRLRWALVEGVVVSLLSAGVVYGIYHAYGLYTKKPKPPRPKLVDMLGVPEDSLLEEVLMSELFALFTWLLAFVVLYTMFFFYFAQGMASGKSVGKIYRPDGSMPSFDDIAGQNHAKDEIVEVVQAIREPLTFRRVGAKVPTGILLVGPPGTGKTLMARAIAGECNCSFISSGGSAFDEMFVGVGAARVRKLFNLARKNAPCVLFIDEIDALAPRRDTVYQASGRQQTVNQLLSELDGFEKNKGLITVAATNLASSLDPALMRPGRLDRQIHMGLPDRQGRLDILRVHTSKKPLAADVRLDHLANTTVQFSGADLANVCNEAAIRAAKERSSTISQKHFSYALERVVLGIERPGLVDEVDQQTVAYHESGHALVALLVPGANKPIKITMVPRGPTLGVTWMMPMKDQMLQSKTALLCEIKTLLGGRAAEELVFGEVTTGAANDLSRATELASKIVKEFGMDREVGLVQHTEDPRGTYRKSSERKTYRIEQQVDKIVNSSYKKVLKMLKENRKMLNKLAKGLLKKEVLEAHEIEELTGLKIHEQRAAKGVLEHVQ